MDGLEDKVTLVIPARGRARLTRSLLAALSRASSRFRIILVDDASESPLQPVTQEFPALRIQCVRNSRALGPAASRNIGIGMCATPYVAFTDNDVEPSATWMDRLFGHLESSPPWVAGVGGRTIDDGTSLVGRYSTRLGLLDPFVRCGRVIYVVTANCMFRRSALDRAKLFDESFVAPGGEDVDLCFRLLRLGYMLESCSEAVVVHHYDPSFRSFWRTFRRYGVGCRMAMASLRRDGVAET